MTALWQFVVPSSLSEPQRPFLWQESEDATYSRFPFLTLVSSCGRCDDVVLPTIKRYYDTHAGYSIDMRSTVAVMFSLLVDLGLLIPHLMGQSQL